MILGRAAEIARAQGSPVGGAEHLFLAMLHDGGWPVRVIADLVDLGEAEAAVARILADPGYSPPAPPRFPVRHGYVHAMGAEVAFELGDCYQGAVHALLAMIRSPQTVPARALASLASLTALEAAVLRAKNAPAPGPPHGAVFLPKGQQIDRRMRRAIIDALPEGSTFAFTEDPGEPNWVQVIGPGDSSDPGLTREVLNAALASLNRAGPDGQPAG